MTVQAATKVLVQRTPTEITLTRLFDAPREMVFAAWTTPDHLQRWFAPDGCTSSACTVDLRVGGLFHYCMRLPDGREVWGRGVYREIVPPERIVYVDTFADVKGSMVEPSYYGFSAGHPSEMLVTVTFEDLGGKTRLTLRHAVPDSVAEREGMVQGWSQMLERLASTLL